MPLRRLDLRITQLAAKTRWLGHLSAFLADARVLGDGTWDVRRMRYEVDLERISYESRLTVPGSDEIYEYPSIACRLSVEPALGCVDDRDAHQEAWEGEIVRSVELRSRGELALVTTYGTTELRLGAGAALEIRDVGEPSEGRTVSDFGHPAIDLRRAGELMRLRVI